MVTAVFHGRISIHASREGSDGSQHIISIDLSDFNPRFPRGKRPSLKCKLIIGNEFQSTLPAREATGTRRMGRIMTQHFNPRFPRGKRPPAGRNLCELSGFQSTLPAREATFQINQSQGHDHYFNPRFPRGKRRHGSAINVSRFIDFNPRFPRGKRRIRVLFWVKPAEISIHASREGSDSATNRRCRALYKFQSTLPAREATK